MKLLGTYRIVFAVGFNGTAICLAAPKEVQEGMDGCFLEDNPFVPREKIPSTPGVYEATVEHWFEQGYFEGYPAPGESDWEFRIKECRTLLPLEPTVDVSKSEA